jgi:hypothetical protein
MKIEASVPLLDDILAQWQSRLGEAHVAYRNHCYRVLNLALAYLPAGADDLEARDKLAVALAFHDLGIWSDGTIDYLAPSRARARAWLADNGREAWGEEVEAIIEQHHRIRRVPAAAGPLAEAVRKADWADVSLGLLRRGLPRGLLAQLRARFPNAGFHRRLLALAGRRLLRKPWSPLPMLRF